MNVERLPAGAPHLFARARPKSRTPLITASRAEVALRSCSSPLPMPATGNSRAGCQSLPSLAGIEVSHSAGKRGAREGRRTDTDLDAASAEAGIAGAAA